MVLQPTTGTTYNNAGFNAKDSRFLERGKLRQVLVRDARGTATNITPQNSDGSVRWSPFAADAQWRSDLLAWQLVSGFWGPNPVSNEGFHLVGAFKDGDGPNTNPVVKNDNFMILQSNFPFDSDTVEEGEAFSFTPVQTAGPIVRRLRNNMRLNDPVTGLSVCELPGVANAGWGRAIDGDNINRQVLMVSQFTRAGLAIYTVDGFDLCKLSNIGKSKKDKKDSEAAQLDYEPLPSGFFMGMVDGQYVPILRWTWQGGPGWTAQLGSPANRWLVTLGTQTTGTFVLTWGGNTTATIAYNATAATVLTALAALDDGYTSANWTVTGSAGGPYTVTTPAPTPLTGSGALLTTPGTFVIAPN
jgi:hypothetical protein